MVSKEFTIKNKMGLHMRAAQVFVSETKQFTSTVSVKFNGKNINAKSMIDLMTACIPCGAEITVLCDGEDERAALEKVTELLERQTLC